MPVRLVVFLLVASCSMPTCSFAQDDTSKFMAAFSQAVKADDFSKQQELVGKHPEPAKNAFFAFEAQYCATGPGEGPESVGMIMEALATVYKLVPPRNDFLLKRFAWVKELNEEQRALKVEAWDFVSPAFARFQNAKNSRSEAAVMEVLPGYVDMATKCEKATDHYWAAQAWWYQAELHQIIPNWFDAVYCYGKALDIGAKGHSAPEVAKLNLDSQMRNAATTGKIRVDLVDFSLPIEECKAKYKAALDAPPTAPPAEGGGAPGAPAEAGKGDAKAALPPGPRANAHAIKIEWEDATDLKASAVAGDFPVQIPNFRANAHWYFWGAVTAKKDADAQDFAILPGKAQIENIGGKVYIYPDGKANAKTRAPIRLKLGSKPEVQEFDDVQYLDNSKGKVWHSLMAQPGNFSINGYGFRTAGTDIGVRLRGATVMKGKARGQDIHVYDINGNGAFNDFGIDAVITGTGKTQKVQPLSRYIMVGDYLFELKIEPNGKSIRTKPYDGPVAPLKFNYAANTKPAAMIAQGSGEDITYYFDLMTAVDHPIWVVPGTFKFFEGFMAQGKGEKAQTILIRGEKAGVMTIEPAKLNSWDMGGAGSGFTFKFKAEITKENGQEIIRIPGKEVSIVGAFGETYEYSMLGAVQPMVLVRKGKEGNAILTEKMKKAESSDLDQDTNLMWFPKKLEIKKPFAGEASVKLECDYKPLGKITSEWSTAN